jgi:hypothetical protein
MLFVTDVTTDAQNRSGDWQYGGTGIFPDKVCGLWFYGVKQMSSNSPDATSMISRPFFFFYLTSSPIFD